MIRGHHVYRGTRTADRGDLVTRDGRPAKFRRGRGGRRYAPTAVSWGYCGTGPHDLAWYLLCEVTQRWIAEDWYDTFCREVVASWEDGWELTTADLCLWLDAHVSGDVEVL